MIRAMHLNQFLLGQDTLIIFRGDFSSARERKREREKEEFLNNQTRISDISLNDLCCLERYFTSSLVCVILATGEIQEIVKNNQLRTASRVGFSGLVLPPCRKFNS